MKTIEIKTQKELDKLPDSFNEFTCIEIRSDKTIRIEVTKHRSNSQVRACDSSQVTAYGSSQVTACDSSQVRACDSSQVTAYGSSQVRACDSSQVTAYGNSMIAVLSALVILHKIKQYAIVALDGVKVKLPKKDKTATVIKRKLVLHNIKSFVDIYDLKIEDDSVILYKSVNPDTLCDFQTGKVKYEGTVEALDFDPSKERECGGGLHLCATPELTQTFNVGKILKCKVKLKDIGVYGKNIMKVRCRKVEVLGEVG